jgi:hypothetical protein
MQESMYHVSYIDDLPLAPERLFFCYMSGSTLVSTKIVGSNEERLCNVEHDVLF